ncbi:trafficking protein particle complex subunit 12-like [Portunus trituberculatus]|uniref:trafficking protein particle complex subunit 12-like n=1 Tax=Portunus trituberculatus TaxID=210409 RepID=UPI001E1CF046|nr:trafficking protein particle complex subunit 12-like [Portunus trituberculatus]
MSNQDPGSSLPVGHQFGDASNFFDQLSAVQDITQQGIPSQPVVTCTTDAIVTSHPQLTIPNSITMNQVPPNLSHTNLLLNEESVNTTSETLTQNQEAMKESESPALPDQPSPVTSLPVSSQQAVPVMYPPCRDVSPQNMLDSQTTIPLTPQSNLPTNESLFVPQVPTPETPQSASSSQSVPTQLTPVQSAMMMSMSTSMMAAAATSPNTSVDVEATTVKFQQASINNDVYPNTQPLESCIAKPDSFNISNAIPSPDSFLTPATEQDVFTASLLSSDADRRHDAWIPQEVTRQALIAMSSSPPGTYFPEKELLTMPGIAVKEDFGDPVKNLVRTYLGEEMSSKRVVLTAASVTQDDRGLRQLIAAGCYHAAVNLTTQLLTVYGQGEGRAGHPSKHTAHSIQLWFTRIALLVKLRRFSLAEVECQYFNDLDAPDLYFEFYPELYGGRKGSMVPFGFRLLVAELPQHLGKHTQALDRLNALLRTCNEIIKNLNNGLSEDGTSLEMTNNMRDDSLKLWRTRRHRVMYSITNCAVSLKDFRLAGSLIERLIQEDPNSAAGLYSALGRLCLQLGDVTAAQETFNQYFEHSLPPPHHDPVQGLLHSAYVSIAQNAFKDAAEILQQAHKINPSNGLVINNYGVCLMYTGRVSEAIALVEGAVFSQPERFLHEAIVLNLATMYELESSNAHQKKLKILSLIAQHKGDSFNVAALKLQPQ